MNLLANSKTDTKEKSLGLVSEGDVKIIKKEQYL